MVAAIILAVTIGSVSAPDVTWEKLADPPTLPVVLFLKAA